MRWCYFHEENLCVTDLPYSSVASFEDLFMVSRKDRKMEGRTRCFWFIVGVNLEVLILKQYEGKDSSKDNHALCPIYLYYYKNI